ncbi:MAG: zinc-ribbon domain-containing protein [Candidatus Thiodiazotropha sp. (ex Myrtea sp. 'scaly one' KF741663)]|nr:zinc-ribbon domain-containing protein [Candidatus Thiodiazotropha sp. (ex Myrtea sp. 'scaly one' KF741663)]
MLTQCPHCQTLFRIGPEQLKVADGKVRCNQCSQIFNALHRLHDSPAPFLQLDDEESEVAWPQTEAEQTPDKQEEEEPTWEESFSTQDDTSQIQDDEIADGEILNSNDSKPDEDSDTLLTVDDTTKESDTDSDLEYVVEQNDGLEIEPDYLAADSESQMSELLDQDSVSTHLQTNDTDKDTAEVIDLNIHEEPAVEAEENETPPGYDFGDSILKDEVIDVLDGRPDYDSIPAFHSNIDEPSGTSLPPVDEKVLAFEAVEAHEKGKKGHALWFFGSLLLVVLLTSQLAWQFRYDLIHYDVGRQVLNVICKITRCEVPNRRDTNKILIEGRNLSTDPSEPDVLFMRLYMVNAAAFDQPFPKLQLSLYDDNGKLVARRTFLPDQYLPESERNKSMMPRAQQILAEMKVIDPGKEVTGFTFDFL